MAQNIDPLDGEGALTDGKTDENGAGVFQDNHAVTKRLQRELMQMMSSVDKGVSAFPDGDTLFKWRATMTGPDSTPYSSLTFRLSVTFPHSYPYAAPSIRFLTPTFHPNVDLSTGVICLDILKDKWSPTYDLRSVLLSIQSLLSEPNVDSPLNPKAAQMYSEDLDKYRQQVIHHNSQPPK